MAKLQFGIDFVVIATANSLDGEITGFLEIGDYP